MRHAMKKNRKHICSNLYFYLDCVLIFFVSTLFSSTAFSCPSTSSQGCSLPPFWSSNISPNVLLVIDESGSMQFPGYFSCDWSGYNGGLTANCGSYDSDETPQKKYNIHQEYYGYFKNDKLYKYDSSNGLFRSVDSVDCNASQLDSRKVCSDNRSIDCILDSDCQGSGHCIYAIGGGECVSGNLLNWATMSRTDLLRKALIGGKHISFDGNNYIIRSEGGNWEFDDLDLMCKIVVQGDASTNDFAHTLDISGLGTNDERECGKLVLKANGSSIWGTNDNFFYIYQVVSGDFDIRLKITKKPDESGTGEWAKTGLMVRSSLSSDSKKIFEAVTRDHGLQFSYRSTDGNETKGNQNNVPDSIPIWLRMVRTGQTFTTYYSTDGVTWHQHPSPDDAYTFSQEPMPDSVYVGIATASYSSSTVAVAKFDDFVCQSGACSSDDFNDQNFHSNIWSSQHIGNEDKGQILQGCSRNCPITVTNAKVQLEVSTNERRGVIQETLDKDSDGQIDNNAPRLGLMVYSSGSDSSDWWTRHGCMRVGVDNTDLDNLVHNIEEELPLSGTPTVYGIREAQDYFQQYDAHNLCDNDAFINRGSSIDPYYYAGTLLSCRKSFVITVSDGEWNTGGDPVDEVHQTHINDLRSDIPGDQVLDHYTLFIFGSDGEGPRAMKNLAMYGGFNDLDGNGWPFDKTDYPNDSRDDDMTLGVCQDQDRPRNCQEWDLNGDGLPDNYFLADNGKAIEQAFRKIFEDIQSNSGSAASVATVTQEVLGEDLVVRGAFTFYDEDPDIYTWRGHLEIYKPFFHCSDFNERNACEARGCTWDNNECTGTPDINYDFQLCSESSCPSQYCIDTGTRCVAKFCSEMTGNKHCIDAGQILNERTSPRNIFTFVQGTQIPFEITGGTDAGFWNDYLQINRDFNNDGQAGDAVDVEELIQFVRGEINGNGTSLRERKDGWKLGDIIYSSPVVVGAPDENSVAPQIAREDCENLQRCFEFTEPNTCNSHDQDFGCFWSYYDNMCTSPDCEDLNQEVCSNQPACRWDAQANECKDKNRDQILTNLSVSADDCFYSFRIHYSDRERVIYVGANDGMLHAFSVDTGEELWAYIPSNLLSDLQCLADPLYGKPGGCRHRYMVDLSPRIWNVKFRSDNKWHTVLVGGERGGGDVYFAIDITKPRNPHVLWEYSVFRNMVLHGNGGPTAPFTKERYLELYGSDDLSLKNIGASWTEPTVAYLKLGSNVKFKASSPVAPLSDSLPPSNFQELGADDLSNWFVIIGGSIRVFNNGTLPDFLTNEEKSLIYKPYLLALDIETGTNIFQNLWPDIVKQLGNYFPEKTNGGNIIPYALSSPLLLDIWDTKGCEYINDSNATIERKEKICTKAKYCTWENGHCQGMLLGPDGLTDHIILGDINGNLYNIKFNFSDEAPHALEIDKLKTKKICDDPSNQQCSDLISQNVFRADRQPITIPPVAAFDDDYTLRIFIGTGKLDNSYGGSDDANDPATMSFYNLREDSGNFTSTTGQLVYSSYASGFDVTIKNKCEGVQFGSNCVWTENGEPDSCCSANCQDTCWDCIYDFSQPGERILYSPLVAGGLVFITTFVPNDDPCSSGGKGYLYILKYNCKDLFEDCGTYNDLGSCTIHQSCFWSGSSCVGCEGFDSNTTCSQNLGCKWVSMDPDHEYCTSTNDILSDSGLKPALGKSISQLETGEYTKIEGKGYGVNLGPGVPSQPVYSQGKGNKSTLFIQTSDAKIFKIDMPSKDKKFLGWSWDQDPATRDLMQ